ncbi:Transposase DDE domain [Raoultella ornithinolytica]|nr:Transposase DDE domain [Raoultella ornithinolytica]
MAKQKFKITNWPTYNKALINRGSITFWLDDEAIQAWYESATPSSRGRPQRYSDLAITTVLVIKRVFRLTLRAAQGFIDSIFTLMNVPLRCPDYTSVSKRAKSVNVSFKTFTRGEIAHLVIDSTGLKVFGEGEWKVKKHGKERRRIWRKLHLAVDSNTHEIICADLSLNNVTDSEAFPGLIRQTHRKSGQHRQTALTTPGSVMMNCGVRKSARLSHPEKARVTGPVNMQTVTVQWLISE